MYRYILAKIKFDFVTRKAVYKFNLAFWISKKCKEYVQQNVICLFLTKTLEQKWVFTFTFYLFCNGFRRKHHKKHLLNEYVSLSQGFSNFFVLRPFSRCFQISATLECYKPQ